MSEIPDWQRYEMMEAEVSRAAAAFDTLKEYLDWCREFRKRPDKFIRRRLKERDDEYAAKEKAKND